MVKSGRLAKHWHETKKHLRKDVESSISIKKTYNIGGKSKNLVMNLSQRKLYLPHLTSSYMIKLARHFEKCCSPRLHFYGPPCTIIPPIPHVNQDFPDLV